MPTAELRDQLRSAGFRNLTVLGRGVDGRLFTPARRSAALRRAWGASESDVVVLYVGRIAAEKNVELAVRAYRAMRETGGVVRFVIVGDGPSSGALREALPDAVFAGVMTGELLAEHYASADVFLFPSATETFGNVTLEAMASGLVVVAYDYAAARAHIEPGRSGVLVPYRDADAFVEAAVALARSPARRLEMRARVRETVAHLHWDHVVARFETWLAETWRARPMSVRSGPRRRSLMSDLLDTWMACSRVAAGAARRGGPACCSLALGTALAHARFATLRARSLTPTLSRRARPLGEAAQLLRRGVLPGGRRRCRTRWPAVSAALDRLAGDAPRPVLGVARLGSGHSRGLLRPALHRRQPRAVSVRARHAGALRSLLGGDRVGRSVLFRPSTGTRPSTWAAPTA